MNANNSLSVVIPLYNAEAYLYQCVDSVLGQFLTCFEIILVDDGSEDKSKKICDEYVKNNSRVKVIHKENEGPTAARLAGAQAASGNYIMFLDSDDYIAQGLLKHLSGILEKYGPDVILFNGIRFKEKGNQVTYDSLLNIGLYKGEDLKMIRNNLIFNEKDTVVIYPSICMKVFRRTLYIKFQRNVPPNLYLGEDLAVTAPLLAECNSIYVSNICGYYYRNTSCSLTNALHYDELEQIKLLSRFLMEMMGTFYESRIDTYVVMRLFDYIDRVIQQYGKYQICRKIFYDIKDEELLNRIRRSKNHNHQFKTRLAFFLVKYRLFTVLWILRKIKQRRR